MNCLLAKQWPPSWSYILVEYFVIDWCFVRALKVRESEYVWAVALIYSARNFTILTSYRWRKGKILSLQNVFFRLFLNSNIRSSRLNCWYFLSVILGGRHRDSSSIIYTQSGSKMTLFTVLLSLFVIAGVFAQDSKCQNI